MERNLIGAEHDEGGRHQAQLLGRGQALRRRQVHGVEVLERRRAAARGRRVRSVFQTATGSVGCHVPATNYAQRFSLCVVF